MLGLPVQDSWSQTYCGAGNLTACKTALWAALEQTAADLQAEFGNPTVANWQRQIADEDIRHTAVGVTAVAPIHWINRPTFQQVVEIGSLDHFKCYKAFATPRFPGSIVSLAEVRRERLFCNPVDKAGEGIDEQSVPQWIRTARESSIRPLA